VVVHEVEEGRYFGTPIPASKRGSASSVSSPMSRTRSQPRPSVGDVSSPQTPATAASTASTPAAAPLPPPCIYCLDVDGDGHAQRMAMLEDDIVTLRTSISSTYVSSMRCNCDTAPQCHRRASPSV
jgi:hypothetical protein